MHFASEFNVFPSLVRPVEINLIFRSLTRDKKHSLGITYEDFQKGLLRVTVKSQGILNKIQERYKDQDHREAMGAKEHEEMQSLINKAKRDQGEAELTQDEAKDIKDNVNYDKNTVANEMEDEYQKLADVNSETMQGLLTFLDVPLEMRALHDKLKSLKKDNLRIAPRDKKLGKINQIY